jgi:hypothetical protein
MRKKVLVLVTPNFLCVPSNSSGSRMVGSGTISSSKHLRISYAATGVFQVLH